MKTRRISTYAAFVRAGRPYYPFVSGETLVLPDFSINADKDGVKHKRALICESVVLYNRKAFCAISYVWHSLYGRRARLFYFRNGQRVTWRQLSYDERRKVCLGFQCFRSRSYRADYHRAPSRNFASWH